MHREPTEGRGRHAFVLFVIDTQRGKGAGATVGTIAVRQAATTTKRRASFGVRARGIARNYFVRRVLKALFTVYMVTTLIFFLIRLLPGNPVEIYVNQQVAQFGLSYDEAVAQARTLFAIDTSKPLPVQYVAYLGRLLHGDLGQSITAPGVPVLKIIRTYLPWTIFSVGTGLLIAFTLGSMLGMLMAYRRGSVLDTLLTGISSLLHSVPNYLLALILIVLFGVRTKLLPITKMRGNLSSGQPVDWSLAFFKDALYHAALPIFIYAVTSIGVWMLLMKSSTVAALDEDYVTAAQARGLSPARVAFAYVGRNAILPLFTQLTIAIGFIVGGSFLIEPIFAYNGIGAQLYTALQRRDYPLMQGIFLMITISVIIANLAADLLYSRLDPRIRTSGGN